MPRRREIIEEYDDHDEVPEERHVVARDEGPAMTMVLGVILAIILAVALLWAIFGANLFSPGPGAPPAPVQPAPAQPAPPRP